MRMFFPLHSCSWSELFAPNGLSISSIDHHSLVKLERVMASAMPSTLRERQSPRICRRALVVGYPLYKLDLGSDSKRFVTAIANLRYDFSIPLVRSHPWIKRFI